MDAVALQDLLDAENHLPKEVRRAMLGHAAAGTEDARRRVESADGDANAHLLLALNLGMKGVALGKVRAFLEGVPNSVLRAANRAAELDEAVRGAGPLQVKGRFRTIVPFPYRDLRAATELLERARTLDPVKQTLFFLGDAYAWQGRLDEAREAWQAALASAPAPHAKPLAPLVDELVRRRLETVGVTRTASPPR